MIDPNEMTGRRFLIVGGLGALLACGSLAYAQQIFVGGGGGSRMRPRFATDADFDGSFLYCRGFYRSVRAENGGHFSCSAWWRHCSRHQLYEGVDGKR